MNYEAIGAISSATILIITIWGLIRINRLKRKKVFISTQMSELDDYNTVWSNTMGLVRTLRQRKLNVFYGNEDIESEEDLNIEDYNWAVYLQELNDCKYFIAIVSEKKISSIFYEAGIAASSKARKCIFFVKETDKLLPIVMRKASSIKSNVRVINYRTFDEIRGTLQNTEILK